jgi:tRNA (guanine-N7-)-methyltransferase
MVRQHVNPLSRYHQQPRPLPPLSELFSNPQLPLVLDIGSARGRFLRSMAAAEPGRNHLGMEIRRPLLDAAEADRIGSGLTNLRYLLGNANISLCHWLESLPAARLDLVTIQFPDPWFKTKHHKRRVLQLPLLRSIAIALSPGHSLFLQSDVKAVIEPMVAMVESSGWFAPSAVADVPLRTTNPLPVPTEREIQVVQQGLPVYRMLYHRGGKPPPARGDWGQAPAAVDNRFGHLAHFLPESPAAVS